MNKYEKWFGPISGLFNSHLGQREVELLHEFDDLLTSIGKREHPPTLLAIRKEFASREFALIDVDREKGGKGLSPILQGAMQFIAGYHSLDYRDIAHVAHGRMIVESGSIKQRGLWTNRLAGGELIGIAATEEHGGSTIQGLRSHATISTDSGGYILKGRKCWISRIKEASAFIIFFRFLDSSDLSAVLLSTDTPGLEISTVQPFGLDGWSWGAMNMNEVAFNSDDLLGVPGKGLGIFRSHFEYYRPMVAIAGLGAAASVFDLVLEQMYFRLKRGDIAHCRDSALEQFGNHFHQITSEMLAAFYAVSLTQHKHPDSQLWSRVSKAGGVTAAYKAVGDLSLLYGASSFQHDHKISKVERDLKGLLFADGLNNELFRSAGQILINQF